MLLPRGLHTRATFSLVFLGWMLGLGLLLLNRYAASEQLPNFATEGWQIMLVWLFLSLAVGALHYGAILIGDSRAVRRRSYGFLVLLQLAFVLTAYIVGVSLSRLLGVILGAYSWDGLLPAIRDSLSGPTIVSGVVFVLVWSSILTFTRQMMVKVGPRVLVNLFLGRYHRPREEQRIFLFIDLKSSTTIAARLGHERYALFIQDCFFDLTDSLLRYGVEVYQYIGDEAVLTWRVEEGVRNANCIRVYFDFIHKLRELAPRYQAAYGVTPFFKAGLNVGPVTVSEIGVVKREIAYLSEVLHTAARIQGQCNALGQGLLLSANMKTYLEGQPELAFTSMGSLELRGKEGSEELFGVHLEGEAITY